ncbi:MAG: hypothetical protein QNL04_04610 [SAR324 cluster bacterium]|nr:hypothetical protein [SAR324 cluster bacterium]
MIAKKEVIFRRIFARSIDMALAALILAMVHKITGRDGMELVGALIIYQTMVILLKGNSLGKELLSIYVKPVGNLPQVRMFFREILLWLLLPFILLALPFAGTPLHDRLTNLAVVEYG